MFKAADNAAVTKNKRVQGSEQVLTYTIQSTTARMSLPQQPLHGHEEDAATAEEQGALVQSHPSNTTSDPDEPSISNVTNATSTPQPSRSKTSLAHDPKAHTGSTATSNNPNGQRGGGNESESESESDDQDSDSESSDSDIDEDIMQQYANGQHMAVTDRTPYNVCSCNMSMFWPR